MVKKILIGLAVLLVLLAGITWFWLRSLIPAYHGEVATNGLTAEVNVHFDSYGIPHIYASSEEDAFFSLGYIIARDRLFQIELIRRLASGRLAEVAGKKLVKSDLLFRTLNLNQHAAWSAEEFDKNAPTHIRKSVYAYIAGVNEFIRNGATPLEFRLMGMEKDSFSLHDVFLINGYIAFGFAEGFRIDPVVESMFRKAGEAHMQELVPAFYNRKTEVQAGPGVVSEALDFSRQTDAVLKSFPVSPWIGSNSWVVSPRKSKTGGTLLCNDTHMGYMQPAVWYEAHIEYPGFRLYGNYLPGLPFPLVGHNDHSGTGLTMMENDDTDFFVETLRGDSVLYSGRWTTLIYREEFVKVKDSTNVKLKIAETPHGPLVQKAVSFIPVSVFEKKQGVSVWWSYLKFPSRSLQALYGLNHAQTMDEARLAASLIDAPGVNVLYGDREGNIAWWAAARLVKRRPGLSSLRFLDGASGKDEPLGYYNFGDNPRSENPASGFVFSANNRPDTTFPVGSYPGYYVPGNRAERIAGKLTQRDDWDTEAMKKLITDDTSTAYAQTARLLRSVLGKIAQDAIRSEAANRLASWAGDHKKETTGAIIYYKWVYNTLRLAMRDEIGDELFEGYMNTHFMKTTYPQLIESEGAGWWDNVATRKKENRNSIVREAWDQTMDELIAQLGKDLSKWNWKRVHTLEHLHPAGRRFPLDRLFNVGPDYVPGGNEVINNTGFGLNAKGEYAVTFGPAMRRIIDFSNPGKSFSVLPTGQSGYFMAPHYADQVPLYRSNSFRYQLMDREEILRQAPTPLRLIPAP